MHGKWKGTYSGKWWGWRVVEAALEYVQRSTKFVLGLVVPVFKVRGSQDKFVIKKPADHG